jgi:CrcB protein
LRRQTATLAVFHEQHKLLVKLSAARALFFKDRLSHLQQSASGICAESCIILAGFPMSIYAVLAVGLGAALGSWLRWGLGTWLNPVLPDLPLGTLAANLIGGYLVGVAIAAFSSHPGLSPEARLFVITGFLGGLTTFSTYSAEAVTLLARSQFGSGIALIVAHVAGSLAMTVLGIATVKWLHAQ